jgi:hypothetical protein
MFSNGIRCFRIVNTCRGGRVAQLGEHLLCKQGVGGSNPLTSTKFPCKMHGLTGATLGLDLRFTVVQTWDELCLPQ